MDAAQPTQLPTDGSAGGACAEVAAITWSTNQLNTGHTCNLRRRMSAKLHDEFQGGHGIHYCRLCTAGGTDWYAASKLEGGTSQPDSEDVHGGCLNVTDGRPACTTTCILAC